MTFDAIGSIVLYGTIGGMTALIWYGPQIPQLLLGAMNPLGSVPGLGQLMSNTTSGAAGQEQYYSPLSGVTLDQMITYQPSYGQSFGPETGNQRSYGPHGGIDFDCRVGGCAGADVAAIISGEVVETRVIGTSANGNSYQIDVQGDDGYLQSYVHVDSLLVKVSDRVKGGQLIAKVSPTDSVSTGPHLDIKIQDSSRNWVNPQKYLAEGKTKNESASRKAAAGKPGQPATGQISEAGVDFIKAYESFHPNPYWDYAQWTWGYGTKAPGASGIITKEQADAELRDHIQNRYIPGIAGTTSTANLTQCEFDALVSFNFNTGAYAGSDLARAINSGNKSAAANEFDRWVHAGGSRLHGLVNRRADEKEMFLSCDYNRDR